MKETKPSREKELETILTLCVFLVLIFFMGEREHLGHKKSLLTIAILLGLIGIFSKYLTSKISWAWLKVGELMGAVMSKVILSVVFFVFLFPIALLSRLFSSNRNNLQLKKTGGNTYYFTRNHLYEAKDLKNLW